MKTKIIFFNELPDNTVIIPGAFEESIGKTVPLRNSNTDEYLGECTILAVTVNEEGVLVTYETDARLGLEIQMPFSVYVDPEEDDDEDM